MSDLYVGCDGQQVTAAPGRPWRIGRGADNDLVVADPTVSRQHAQLTWGTGGWLYESLGRSGTYRDGQPVTRLLVSEPVVLSLASPQGPVLWLEPASAPSPQAPQPAADGPLETVSASEGLSDGPAVTAGPPVPPVPGHTAEFGLEPEAGQPSRGPGHARTPPGWQGMTVPSRDDLAAAFQILVPVQSWVKNPGWRRGLPLLIIVYGLLPLFFIALFSSSSNLTTPGWAYSLYIAPLWGIAFWLLIRPGQLRRQEIAIGVGSIVWVLIWSQLITITINDHLGHPGKALGILDALAVGYNEETAKALPVLLAALLLLRWRGIKLDVRVWMFLGTIVGLTFGVREQAFYAPQALQVITNLSLTHALGKISQTQAQTLAVSSELFFAMRVFVDGFQHAIWAGVSGFFMGVAVNYPRRRIQLILLGISIPAVLHGLNDWVASNFASDYLPWILLQAVSLLVFIGYTMSAYSIEREVRRTPIFRGDSMLMEKYTEPGGPASP